ncbi:hypothetical protein CLCR_09249 [Cladophialophora carrionii]|uniref:Uncharacterized protein n=1 Tax=Cladophialophora carrionii TaxID=86049 RepID=A0A1C1CUD6_9EURO|nr:hypothetical protein CLCR_09249 [Cladophialophora carrionii]
MYALLMKSVGMRRELDSYRSREERTQPRWKYVVHHGASGVGRRMRRMPSSHAAQHASQHQDRNGRDVVRILHPSISGYFTCARTGEGLPDSQLSKPWRRSALSMLGAESLTFPVERREMLRIGELGADVALTLGTFDCTGV